MSPEQALGQPVTGQSDLYSLGIVLYEMLTGDVPFKGDTPVAVAMKHVREELPDVQRMRPEVSAALAAVVDTRDGQAPGGSLRQRRRADRRPRGCAGDRDRARGPGHRRGDAVLRTLPAGTQRRVPFRVRHSASVGVLVARRDRGAGRAARSPGSSRERTTAPGSSRDGARPRGSTPGRLGQNAAHDFNPFGTGPENPDSRPRDRRRPEHRLEHRALLRQQRSKGRRRRHRAVPRRRPGSRPDARSRSRRRRPASARRSTSRNQMT